MNSGLRLVLQGDNVCLNRAFSSWSANGWIFWKGNEIQFWFFSNLFHWNPEIFPTCFIENLGFFPTCFTENSGFFRDLVSRLIIRSRLLKVKSRVLFAGISLIYNYREHESNQKPNYRYLFIYKSEKFGIWEWPAM